MGQMGSLPRQAEAAALASARGVRIRLRRTETAGNCVRDGRRQVAGTNSMRAQQSLTRARAAQITRRAPLSGHVPRRARARRPSKRRLQRALRANRRGLPETPPQRPRLRRQPPRAAPRHCHEVYRLWRRLSGPQRPASRESGPASPTRSSLSAPSLTAPKMLPSDHSMRQPQSVSVAAVFFGASSAPDLYFLRGLVRCVA